MSNKVCIIPSERKQWNNVRERIYDYYDCLSYAFQDLTARTMFVEHDPETGVITEERSVTAEFAQKYSRIIIQHWKDTIDRLAKQLFDAQIDVYYCYSYSSELKENLEAQGHKVYESEFLSPNTGRNCHLLSMNTSTTLRELTGDFQFRYSGNKGIRTTDVRYALRRQLSYLRERPGFEKAIIRIPYRKWIREHRFLKDMDVDAFTKSLLPYAYESVLIANIKESEFNLMCVKRYSVSGSYYLYKLYKILGEEVLTYADQLEVVPTDVLGENPVHDAFFFYCGLEKYLTKATLRKCLMQPVEVNREIMETFQKLLPLLPDSQTKDLRKILKYAVMRGGKQYLSEMLNEYNELHKQSFYKKLRVSEQEAESFVEQMKRYDDSVAVTSLVKTLGLQTARNAIKGTARGLFEPKDYSIPLDFVSEDIRMALGNKRKGIAGTAKSPKRMFHRLSKIGFVPTMINGQITKEQAAAVLDEFKLLGHSVPKEHHRAIELFGRIEPKCSSNFLTAGNATSCCMSFGSAKLTQYAHQKGFGIYNIYLGDRVIANSLLWIQQMGPHRFLVLDNIEVHPNYAQYNPYIQNLYEVMMGDVMKHYECIATVQGESYNDLTLPLIKHPILLFDWKPVGVEINVDKSLYLDARYRVFPVATLQSEIEMKQWETEYSRTHQKRSESLEEVYQNAIAMFHSATDADDVTFDWAAGDEIPF